MAEICRVGGTLFLQEGAPLPPLRDWSCRGERRQLYSFRVADRAIRGRGQWAESARPIQRSWQPPGSGPGSVLPTNAVVSLWTRSGSPAWASALRPGRWGREVEREGGSLESGRRMSSVPVPECSLRAGLRHQERHMAVNPPEKVLACMEFVFLVGSRGGGTSLPCWPPSPLGWLRGLRVGGTPGPLGWLLESECHGVALASWRLEREGAVLQGQVGLGGPCPPPLLVQKSGRQRAQ